MKLAVVDYTFFYFLFFFCLSDEPSQKIDDIEQFKNGHSIRVELALAGVGMRNFPSIRKFSGTKRTILFY